jgi:hypothetical protein
LSAGHLGPLMCAGHAPTLQCKSWCSSHYDTEGSSA